MKGAALNLLNLQMTGDCKEVAKAFGARTGDIPSVAMKIQSIHAFEYTNQCLHTGKMSALPGYPWACQSISLDPRFDCSVPV